LARDRTKAAKPEKRQQIGKAALYDTGLSTADLGIKVCCSNQPIMLKPLCYKEISRFVNTISGSGWLYQVI